MWLLFSMSFVLALITSLIEAKMKHLTLEYSTRLNQSHTSLATSPSNNSIKTAKRTDGLFLKTNKLRASVTKFG